MICSARLSTLGFGPMVLSIMSEPDDAPIFHQGLENLVVHVPSMGLNRSIVGINYSNGAPQQGQCIKHHGLIDCAKSTMTP